MKVLEESIKCTVCGEQSTQRINYSRNTFGAKRHLDNRFDNGVVDVAMQECPHCHYTKYDISKEDTNAKKIVKSASYQNILNSDLDKEAKRFVLAAIIAEKEKALKVASNYYLLATWTLEDAKDTINATKYRKIAYKHLCKIADEKCDGTIFLQCLDLVRKNGEFKKALEHVNEVKCSLAESGPDFKKTDIYAEILKIVEFEEQLINKNDSADHFFEEIE